MESQVVENNLDAAEWDMIPLFKDANNEIFSVDDIINAYLAGKLDSLKKFEEKAVGEAFGKNLNLAKEGSVTFYLRLLEKGIEAERVYLKIKSRERFNALFVIDEDQWCDDGFDSFYEEAMEIQAQLNTESFDYSIILMPKSESFNREALLSDGYLLSYGV